MTESPPAPSYIYRAVCRRVIDGDTVVLDIDCGLHAWLHEQHVRLAGIDTPEIRGAERVAGLVSREWLVRRMEGRSLVIQTEKDRAGKYGRWLARIYVEGGACVNDELLAAGLAVGL